MKDINKINIEDIRTGQGVDIDNEGRTWGVDKTEESLKMLAEKINEIIEQLK